MKQGKWSFYAGESFGGSGQPQVEAGKFKLDIAQPGGPVYALQLIQAPVKIKKDTTYKLTYQAKAEAPRSIAVKVGGTADRNWADYTGGITDQLATELKTYEHYFTMNEKTDPQARVEFQLGKKESNVWIDKVKLQPVEKKWGSNLLNNSKFDQAIDTDKSQVKQGKWSFYAGESFGGSGQAQIEAGKFKINVDQPGGPVYALQLIQTPVKIEKGTAYKLTYQAKAEAPRSMAVKVGGTADRNWADYTGGITDKLTTEMKTYEHIFVMQEKTDSKARVEFQLGKEQPNVWLDNIKLEKYLLPNDEKFSEQQSQTEEKSDDSSVEAYPRVVKNGDFSAGIDHWGTEGSIEISTSEGLLKAEVKDVGSETYSTQVNQFGLQMIKGVDYRVTFQAKADQPRKVKLGLGKPLDSDPWYVDYLGDVKKTYQLGTEMETYGFEFSMTEESYDDAKLTFELGNIEGGNAKTTVYFDNIKVVPDYKDPQLGRKEKIDKLLSLMTLEEKIGQMIQAERRHITPEQVNKYKVGSILSGGGSTPSPNTPQAWADMYRKFQASALETRLGIPMIYGVDAVHGHNNVKGATIFPHNIGLGATRDPEIVQEVGRITAKEAAATGMDWNFSPCVAVVRDIRWGRTYESFGETPALQKQLAGAYVAGLQGSNAEMSGDRLVATAKHFVGDGGARWGTGDADYQIDRGNLPVDEETLRRIHLPGYLEAIEQDVGTIMASYSSWQGKKLHEHKYLLTDVLKEELGFNGFIVSDWNAINEISKLTFYGKVVTAVNAGVDMFMQPSNWRKFSETLTKAVEKDDVSKERINDAVRRILRVKYGADLFKEPLVNRELLESVGSDQHREVAREAVRESLVLLKNQQELLPLDKGADVYVAGSNADDLGSQCGGWTIKWQGATGDITEGTTILEGIKQTLHDSGRVVENVTEADVGVVVVGEDPYTEGKGDDGKLQLTDSDLEAIEEVRAAGKPVAVVMISGRPLMISDYIDNWDAFVAAWLPGTEGQGVADVLFGDYNFKGQLPVTWPKSINQVPINKGDADYNPLFKYGAGMKMNLKN